MRRSFSLSFASLLVLPALVSCGGDSVPTTAPEAAKDPAAILGHLQYAAVRKDFKALPLIAPITPNVVFPGAMNLHNAAKQLGVTLAADELAGLGVDAALAAKFDSLPGSEVDGYGSKEARLAYNAGIYRTLKALTPKTWGKMTHMGIKDEVNLGIAVKQMALGFDGKAVMTVSCLKMPNGNWGISFIRYEVAPKNLKQD